MATSPGALTRRFLVASAAAALMVIASTSRAPAAVTLGQLAPGAAAIACNVSDIDYLSPSPTSGNSYVVPGNGTITSWTHNAGPNPGAQVTMKIFRNVAGLTWLAVGHDGPHGLVPGGTAGNTFATSIAVQRGDVLGINSANGTNVTNACIFFVLGSPYLRTIGPGLSDGTSGNFTSLSGDRVNVTAVFVPTNAFSFGDTTRNKKKGTARLTIDVPNDGNLKVSGTGATAAEAAASTTAVKAGTVSLRIKATGKNRRRLNERGKVVLSLDFTFTPTGGDPSHQTRKVKLKKRL